jgi:hypothetical protein
MRAILLCPLLLISAGCFLGDPGTARIVSLGLVPPEKPKMSLALSDAQVQEALERIDTGLTSAGLTRVPSPQVPSSDGSIAHYSGPPTRGCSVSLKDDKLVIVFFEFGHRHPSEDVNRISASLKRDLASYYDASKISITQR